MMSTTKLWRYLFYMGALLVVSMVWAAPAHLLPGISVADLVKLSQTGNDGVRNHAIVTLSMYDVPEAETALVAALNDRWYANRWRAAEGLGKIGGPSHIDSLLARLSTEVRWEKEDEQSASGAAKHYQGLRVMGSVTVPEFTQNRMALAIRVILRRGSVPGASEAKLKVLSMMSDPSLEYRVGAWMALILGKLGDKRSVPVLIDVLGNEPSGFLRAISARTLGDLGAREAIPALRAALDDPYVTPDERQSRPDERQSRRVRDEAARAIKKIEEGR